MEKRNIILFTDSLGAGGAQRQLVGLAVLLRQNGYIVNVVTYFAQDFFKPFLDEHGVDNVVLSQAANHLKRIPAIYNFLKKEKPDIVIAYQETPSLIACLCKLFGLKYRLIVSERNTTQRVGTNERIRFILYHYADAIVPNSYAQESFLASRCSWMRNKLYAIVNFVDLQKYNVAPHVRGNKPVIIVVASVWPPKNTLGMLKACKLLNERKVDYLLEWYGLVDVSANYAENCKSYIDNNNLTNVKLLPKTKDIVDKYQKADYFCLPSFYEGTPNVICEAISCGKPVICSNVCDNSRYVKEGENGFLFDPKDPVSIADKIEQALNTSYDNYQQMCVNSRRTAELMFNIERFYKEYECILNKFE